MVLMTVDETQDLSPDGAWLTALAERYISMLDREGIPLSASISVAAMLGDLFELAGTLAPARIQYVVGD